MEKTYLSGVQTLETSASVRVTVAGLRLLPVVGAVALLAFSAGDLGVAEIVVSTNVAPAIFLQ